MVIKIRAALRVHLPPTIMWNPAETTWGTTALTLLQAFQMYDDSLCKSCGQSSLHAFEVANTREFTVDTAVCLGCNVRESWSATHEDDKTKGLKLYVVNKMGQGGDEDG